MRGKRTILLLVARAMAGAMVAALLAGCHRDDADDVGDKPVVAQSRVESGTNGESVVRLDMSTQKLIGLQTASLEPATQPPTLQAYGRVLEPAPLLSLVSDVASARTALEASRNEYQRVKTLFAQGQNTSAKMLETAQAAMQHDQIALQAAQAQLVAAWGTSVTDRPDLPAFLESLARLENVVVRLDVPAGSVVPEAPVGGRVLLPGTNTPIEAQFLGRATTTDPQVQGAGFLFVATNNPARLAPGLALTGYLLLPGAPRHGVVVPNAAIVRAADRAWAYLQTGDTTFKRREVALDQPVPGGWFVTSGFAPNDRLVVTGAQTLLSEELKTQIQVGD